MKRLRNQERPYTAADIRILVNGYLDCEPVAKIAERLGRSFKSVKVKASELRREGMMIPRNPGAPREGDVGPVPVLTDFGA